MRSGPQNGPKNDPKSDQKGCPKSTTGNLKNDQESNARGVFGLPKPFQNQAENDPKSHPKKKPNSITIYDILGAKMEPKVGLKSLKVKV